MGIVQVSKPDSRDYASRVDRCLTGFDLQDKARGIIDLGVESSLEQKKTKTCNMIGFSVLLKERKKLWDGDSVQEGETLRVGPLENVDSVIISKSKWLKRTAIMAEDVEAQT
ncbi:hypothetical protein J6590_074103 [Homalodisca vitripennis]|nr:hypothetical protein J6590_074103 [Homalodisca vitripennis]